MNYAFKGWALLGTEILASLLATSVKIFILGAFIFFILKLFRVKNPRIEHPAWAIVLLGMLLLPLASYFLTPLFSFSVVPESLEESSLGQALASVSGAVDSDAANLKTLRIALLSIYFVGLVIMLSRFAVGLFRTRRLVNSCQKINDERLAELCERLTENSILKNQITVLSCAEMKFPVTTGLLKPKILLPEDWATWEDLKLKSVMAHETAHILRRDYLFLLLATLNKCVNWFNPLSWLVARRLSDLAETASDNSAVYFVKDRSRYATYLLQLAAKSEHGAKYFNINSVTMVRGSQVKERINSILQTDINRIKEKFYSKVLICVFCLCSLLAIGVTRLVLPDDCPYSKMLKKSAHQSGVVH